jgi:hypothetical protein
MLRHNNNLFTVLLSDATVATSTIPAEGALVSNQTLPQGAIVLCTPGLVRLSAAAFAALPNGAQFIVVQGKGASQPLMKSPVITKGKFTTSIAAHKAAVQQVTVVGFNGTTGALPVANDTAFHIKIRKNDNDAANRSQPMSQFIGPVKTDGTGTQEELALALAVNGNKNFALEPANGYLKIEVLCDDAGAAIGAAPDTVVGTIGTKVVTLTDTGANNSISAIAVGDLFRVGTALTSEVYKIVATTVVGGATGTITLDRPLSQSVNLVGTTAEFITAANAATADFGIRLTGVQAPFDVNAFRDYYANRFTATFSDPSTLVSHVQGAYNGNGTWQQVAMDEYMNYGFEGQNEMMAVPPRMRDQEVKIPGVGGVTALTAKYSALSINWEEDITGLVSKSGSKGSVLVYLNLTNNAGSGELATAPDNVGETFALAMGLTPADFNE